MKRVLSGILACTMAVLFSIFGYAEETSKPSTPLGEKAFEYISRGDWKMLADSEYYGYLSFTREFRSNSMSMSFLATIDKLIDTGAKPDKEKYMDVLINLIGTYDSENSTDIAKQKEQDNLKGAKEYGEDIIDIAKDSISYFGGSYPAVTEIESYVSHAMEAVYQGKESVENWIETLSELETVIQNYGRYDLFLQTVEENTSDKDLKDACSTLRTSMQKAAKIRMESYNDVKDKNFENWSGAFFSESFFTAVRAIPEYASDDTFQFFVDGADDFLSKVGTLKSSWELGKKIGTLVGNLTVGGENLINRVLEMMALHDINESLRTATLNLQNTFLDSMGTEEEEGLADQYITLLKYVIGCHIRGEYCLYSVVASDAGLLSWFNKQSVQEAEAWYENQAKILSDADAVLDNMVEQAGINFVNQLSNRIQNGLDFEMREENLEFCTSDGILVYTNTIKYPYFIGEGYFEKKLNLKFQNLINEYKSNHKNTDFDEYYNEGLQWSSEGAFPFYDDIEIDVTYNKNGYLSYLEQKISWSGGMHPYQSEKGVIIELRTGEEISYTDIIIGSESQIDSVLNYYMEKTVGKVEPYMLDNLKKYSAFVLTDEGGCFYYNVGDAVDREEIIIPFTNEKSCVILAKDAIQHEKVNENDIDDDKIDLSAYMGTDIIRFTEMIGGMHEQENYSVERVFENDFLSVAGTWKDYSRVDKENPTIFDICISGECEYSLFGLYFGMDKNLAEQYLLSNGWGYDSNSMYKKEEYMLVITSDSDSHLKSIYLYKPL